MAERITEHLKFETELLKLTALGTLATGGGTVGLMLSDPTPKRLFFIVCGVIVSLAAAVTLLRQLWAMRASIATIEEQTS